MDQEATMTLHRTLPLAVFLALGAPLAAQEPHFGFGIALSVPTGALNSTAYPPSGTVASPATESYDTTLGAQFTASFPMDRKTAIRLDVYGESSNGSNQAAGYQAFDLRHRLLSIGGELQVFPGLGSAERHRGGYLLGGLSMDLERFESSQGFPNYYGSGVDRTRLGGLVGAGFSFRPYGYWRSNVEVAFHKTLTNTSAGSDAASASPGTPAADFIRFTYGIIF
jgi:hypothetical protein